MNETRLYTIRRKAFKKRRQRSELAACQLMQASMQAIIATVNETSGESDETANTFPDRMN